MTLVNPAGLWLLALAIPVLALHILRPRRVRHEVSSTFLWSTMATPVSSAKPWQKLKPSVLLLLQLLAVALLALAVAQPARLQPTQLAQHTVFIIDASGSMLATDGHPDRLADAKAKAQELRGELPANGKASVVVASDQPRVVLTASSDPTAFDNALGPIEATTGRADFATTFSLAASLETPDAPIGFEIISDGGLTDDEKRLIPAGSHYDKIGDQNTNRGIARLSVEPRGSGLHARVTVVNTGGDASTQSVRLDVDGRTVNTTDVTLAQGETKDVEVDIPAGDRVEAFLPGEDLLGADNHAFAVVARRRALKVLTIGKPDTFVDQFLAAQTGVTVDHSDAAKAGDGYDLVIYDQVDVLADPGAPFIAIAPPSGLPAAPGSTDPAAPPGVPVVKVDGVADRPAITLVRSDDALLQSVDLSKVAIRTAEQVTAPTAETLIGAESAPLLVRGTLGKRPFVYFTFALADSNLPVNIAFPIIGDRLMTALASAELPPTDLLVGERLPVDTSVATSVVDPEGVATPLTPGRAAPPASHGGFWTIKADGRPDRVVAVNVPASESRLDPAETLPTPERTPVPGQEAPQGQTPVLWWVIVPLLLIIVAEFLLARRRVGVSKRQWRTAVVVRAAIVLLLIAALLGLNLSKSADRVATIFLIDASDSIGTAQKTEAVAFVHDALQDQPSGSLSGVALFGGDARLELTVQEGNQLGQPAVKIDPTRTDLAGGLRLAGALLPSDARRRIVLVSDGRATQGDVAAEATRLADQGIVVDTHVVGRKADVDAAVASIDVPAVARKGDSVELKAKIISSGDFSALVTLEADGKAADEKQVDLKTGDNTVVFTVPAGDPGLQRYRVRVSVGGDGVPENNQGFAAVQVQGPARVLMVEGTSGEASTLSTALTATGMTVDTVSPDKVPALDQLAQYASTVLVDVDVHDLSADQISSLGASARDLGHGLVTVGGDHAYGLGGYRDSELEKYLPVISEVTDPKRRRSVAQVLAIDTSGSMAACHCAEGNNGVRGGNMVTGGVMKDDIARSGAQRAIDALSKDDEIGLLSINSTDQWLIDLQKVPSEDVVKNGLGAVRPSGGTSLTTSLETSAKELRNSKASLKHIILFTDGFTSQQALVDLAAQAKKIHDEDGITVSVFATGEGAAVQLKDVATAGGGRFYPGKDLNQIPQIMQQEVVLASRDFIQEGDFFPEITGTTEATRDLTSSPSLLGYVATTAKPTAGQALKIGPEHDPLLATWQLGLGKVTSWTSDASAKWSQKWSTWDGYQKFWSALVKETFPSANGGSGGVTARVSNGRLTVTVENETAFADGSKATARVTGPDLQGHDVPLERTNGTTFAGDLAVGDAGTYAVGAQVQGPDGSTQLSASTIANQSYSPEYVPGEPDRATMQKIATISHGRVDITAAQAFDPLDLPPGRTVVTLAAWLCLLAALLWPLALALSRLAFHGTAIRTVTYRAGRTVDWVRSKSPGRPGSDPTDRPTAAPRDKPKKPEKYIDLETEERRAREAAPPETINRLLDRKRGVRGGDPPAPP